MKGMEITLSLILLLLNFSPRRALPLSPSISCCTQVYQKNLPIKLLRNVNRVDLQEANGDCHIKAYVLHRKHGSPVCVHPKNRSLARWLSRNRMIKKSCSHKPGLCPPA
ncbi:C-C motif chemokine 27 [Sarcophilus harrisii]|uniref:Chemokine interleukin-8-like domain-containing protein n=2 Tax=Sarcophilus harrisii TaxID=9305 RepID=A0A7N4V7T6_SARHA